jgi:hypothetical protein
MLDDVKTVFSLFNESDELPVIVRAVEYAYLQLKGLPKTKTTERQIYRICDRGRRSGEIPWDWVTEEKSVSREPLWYPGAEGYLDSVRDEAEWIDLVYRQSGQPLILVVWCEAVGRVDSIRSVVGDFGIPVYSGGGSDPLTTKRRLGVRLASYQQPVLVGHIGDLDRPGVKNIFEPLKADLEAFASAHGGDVEVVRLGVLREHVERWTIRPKPGKDGSDTWEAEAYPPGALATVLREWVAQTWNDDAFRRVLEQQEDERRRLLTQLKPDDQEEG